MVAYIVRNRSSVNHAKPPSQLPHSAFLFTPNVKRPKATAHHSRLKHAVLVIFTRLSTSTTFHPYLPRSKTLPFTRLHAIATWSSCSLPINSLQILTFDTSLTPAEAISVHPEFNHIVTSDEISSKEPYHRADRADRPPNRPTQVHRSRRRDLESGTTDLAQIAGAPAASVRRAISLKPNWRRRSLKRQLRPAARGLRADRLASTRVCIRP